MKRCSIEKMTPPVFSDNSLSAFGDETEFVGAIWRDIGVIIGAMARYCREQILADVLSSVAAGSVASRKSFWHRSCKPKNHKQINSFLLFEANRLAPPIGFFL